MSEEQVDNYVGNKSVRGCLMVLVHVFVYLMMSLICFELSNDKRLVAAFGYPIFGTIFVFLALRSCFPFPITGLLWMGIDRIVAWRNRILGI